MAHKVPLWTIFDAGFSSHAFVRIMLSLPKVICIENMKKTRKFGKLVLFPLTKLEFLVKFSSCIVCFSYHQLAKRETNWYLNKN